MPNTQSTTSGWSVVSSPNINIANAQANFIEAVTCASASECWAVGSHDDGHGSSQTLIERWDGSAWLFIDSLDPPATNGYGNVLNGVTCVSASDCWAVGSSNLTRPLIKRWDGNAWAVVASPNINADLYAVTCTSGSDCWAVGYNHNNGYQPLIEHWDGNAWTIAASPNTVDGTLYAVTCSSGSDCWAVGYNQNNGYLTLTEHWDGNAWAIVASPNVDANDRLYSVTCVTSSDCWAVGYSDMSPGSQTLIERWNGSSWSIVSAASATPILRSVTCTTASNCWAVGSVIEHWDGNSWTGVASPTIGELGGVTCISASDCWAAGTSFYDYPGQTLIEHWNGTAWDVVTSPDFGDTEDNVLSGVACASASDCWATGYSYRDSLIQRWDGNSWSITEAPRNYYSSAGPEVLSGVVCTSASECWSMGNGEYLFSLINYPGTYYGVFIDRWNGESWSIGATFGVHPARVTKLYSAACTSGSDCWAVGTDIEHWDGNSWTGRAFPTIPGSYITVLSGITCASASDCWAVGSTSYYVNGGVPLEQTLIERWNGTGWSIIASPNTDSSHSNRLNSVACPTTSNCFAVGSYVNDTGQKEQLLEHWDGASWVIIDSPDPGTHGSELRGIVCPLATQCWTVGYFNNDNDLSRTLVEYWNGSLWSVVVSPNSSSSHANQLNNVTCASAMDCTAVGQREQNGAAQTLIEHWLSPVKLVSAVSRKSHGNASAFDINLPLTKKPGVECRSGSATGSYQVVLTFAAPITLEKANFVSGAGHIDNTIVSGREVTLNLSGVANAQTIVIRFTGVSDGTESGDVDIPMGVLFGDITGNGVVNTSDVGAVKKWTGQPVSAFGFREDVNANGVINSSDLAAVKAVAGTALP